MLDRTGAYEKRDATAKSKRYQRSPATPGLWLEALRRDGYRRRMFGCSQDNEGKNDVTEACLYGAI